MENKTVTVSNETLSLVVSLRGAEMKSLKTADGVEYLWQADPNFWGETAPVLFPFVGRLTNGGYRLNGKFYPLPQHGFASSSLFSVFRKEKESLVLLLEETEESLSMYPFSFRFFVGFTLLEDGVEVSFRVENKSDGVMPFGIGGHPGFRVPLLPDEAFEDYVLSFSTQGKPDRVGFTEKVFLSGVDTPYPLQEDRFLPLRHDLFDEDAVILKNMARSVSLLSRKSGRGVTVSYPTMPYLGIWHWPKTKAEYVCLEPWQSLPSRQGVEEEFLCKSDLVHLSPGESYDASFTVRVM